MRCLFLLLKCLTFWQVVAFSSPGRGSLQQPSCLETSGLRQHYWFEIQQIASCLHFWLDIKRSTYALYHSSLLTGTTSLAAGSPLGHLQIDSYLQWSNTIITVLTALFVYYDHQLEHLPKESSPPHAPAGLWVAPEWHCLLWFILRMIKDGLIQYLKHLTSAILLCILLVKRSEIKILTMNRESWAWHSIFRE